MTGGAAAWPWGPTAPPPATASSSLASAARVLTVLAACGFALLALLTFVGSAEAVHLASQAQYSPAADAVTAHPWDDAVVALLRFLLTLALVPVVVTSVVLWLAAKETRRGPHAVAVVVLLLLQVGVVLLTHAGEGTDLTPFFDGHDRWLYARETATIAALPLAQLGLAIATLALVSGNRGRRT